MSERIPITDIETLRQLDNRDVLYGYLRGLKGGDEPGIEFNRDFWHGWRNGMIDGGHRQPDADSAVLARVVIASGYLRELALDEPPKDRAEC